MVLRWWVAASAARWGRRTNARTAARSWGGAQRRLCRRCRAGRRGWRVKVGDTDGALVGAAVGAMRMPHSVRTCVPSVWSKQKGEAEASELAAPRTARGEKRWRVGHRYNSSTYSNTNRTAPAADDDMDPSRSFRAPLLALASASAAPSGSSMPRSGQRAGAESRPSCSARRSDAGGRWSAGDARARVAARLSLLTGLDAGLPGPCEGDCSADGDAGAATSGWVDGE